MTTSFEAFEAWMESDGSISFDPHAQDPSDWSWLQEFIPGLIISSAGGQIPFQAEGLYLGYPFYFRDRHGSASLSVGALDGEMPYHGNDILYYASVETEEFEGAKNFIKNLIALVPELKRSPYSYTFIGKTLDLTKSGSGYAISEDKSTHYPAWGYTPDEAYMSLLEPSQYLVDHGFSIERQAQMNKDMDFDRTPLDDDSRKFPVTDPDFRINLM